jgi:L-threonylcarbamoyladenylate synthase
MVSLIRSVSMNLRYGKEEFWFLGVVCTLVNTVSWKQAEGMLAAGAIGVLPTDTIYGLHGRADDPAMIERMFEVRRRDAGKPFVVLVGRVGDVMSLGIEVNDRTLSTLERIWPAPVSVVLPCVREDIAYLHRGTESLALRMPDQPKLLSVLQAIGPLASTSANHAGKSPARTIEEAQSYFGNDIDFYVEGGVLPGDPSTIISFDMDGKLQVLREGAFKLNESENYLCTV